MLRSIPALCLVFLVPSILAQQAGTPIGENDSGISLRVTTRLVVVDTVVTDKQGHPVNDLKADEVAVLEDGKPQKLGLFSRVPDAAENSRPAADPLPPNVFSNRPEYHHPTGPPVLLLLDVLNSQLLDQARVRQRALRYLAEQAKAKRRIAILALINDLVVLQDFSSDPEVLAAAIEKLSPQKAVAATRGEPFTITPQMAAGLTANMLNSLKRLNQEQAVNSVDDRVRITLSSLNAIARAMIGYPGRKNLVWVSAGFPVSLVLEGRHSDLSRSYSKDVLETATLLSEAQVAVYPVDSRGLPGGLRQSSDSGELVPTIVAPEESGGADDPLINSTQVTDASHMAMEQMARGTGGKAFYNANDLDRAVASSIADGSSYYALGYYPENKKWDGKYRKISVKIRRKGLMTRYRKGYYAFDSVTAIKPLGQSQLQDRLKELQKAASDPLPATGVTFKAQVKPPKPGDKNTDINLVVDSASISFTEASPDRHKCDLDFAAFLVAADGASTARVHKNLVSLLPAEQYSDVRLHGLPFHFQLEAAPTGGELRLVIRDNQTGLIGTLSIALKGD